MEHWFYQSEFSKNFQIVHVFVSLKRLIAHVIASFIMLKGIFALHHIAS